MEQTQMLTTAEAARQLGIDVRSVQRLLNNGKLTGSKFGRDWQVDSQSVTVYQSSRRRKKSQAKSGV